MANQAETISGLSWAYGPAWVAVCAILGCVAPGCQSRHIQVRPAQDSTPGAAPEHTWSSADACGVAPIAAAEDDHTLSVQLGLVGPFSGAPTTMRSHTLDARDAGVEAIYWTPDDWRVANEHQVTRFGFGGFVEALHVDESWTALTEREKGGEKQWVAAAAYDWPNVPDIRNGDAFDGSDYLRLAAPAGFTPFGREYVVQMRLVSEGRRHSRPLAAGVTVAIAVRPEKLDDGTAIFIDVSFASTPTRDAVERTLRYVIGAEAATPATGGEVHAIQLPYDDEAWTTYELPISTDATAAFGGGDPVDNTMVGLTLGVAALEGSGILNELETQVKADFDALTIRQQYAAAPLLERMQRISAGLSAEIPEVSHWLGIRASLWEPFSCYVPGLPQVPHADYDNLGTAVSVASATLQRAHAAGGLVSYDGVFAWPAPPAPPASALVDTLADLGLHEADLLQLGPHPEGRDLEEQLWIWDQLGRSGSFPVGIGVSGSSAGLGEGYADRLNNYVTWARVPASTDAATRHQELLAALRAGRAVFGDATRGVADVWIETDSGHPMGAVVLTDQPSAQIIVRGRNLSVGDQVRVVRNGVPLSQTRVAITDGDALTALVDLGGTEAEPTGVRAEIRSATGAIKTVTNPVWFVRAAPTSGLPAERGAFHIGGVSSRRISRLVLRDAQLQGGQLVVQLAPAEALGGAAQSGEMVVDMATSQPPASVTLRGFDGCFVHHGSTVVLGDLVLSDPPPANGVGELVIELSL